MSWTGRNMAEWCEYHKCDQSECEDKDHFNDLNDVDWEKFWTGQEERLDAEREDGGHEGVRS